jgi:hypothetical protein
VLLPTPRTRFPPSAICTTGASLPPTVGEGNPLTCVLPIPRPPQDGQAVLRKVRRELPRQGASTGREHMFGQVRRRLCARNASSACLFSISKPKSDLFAEGRRPLAVVVTLLLSIAIHPCLFAGVYTNTWNPNRRWVQEWQSSHRKCQGCENGGQFFRRSCGGAPVVFF